MSQDQYLCNACLRKFPCSEAVDGLKSGYPKGFLCPLCGANLVETHQSDDPNNLEYGYSYLLFTVVYFYLIEDIDFGIQLFELDWANHLAIALLVYFVISSPFIWINRKLLFGSKTVFTRKINSNK